MIRQSIHKHLVVLLIFSLLAIYITYPLILHMTDKISSFGDEYLIIFIQNWVIHSIFSNPLHLFNAPIYYPFQLSLTYSETFITSSVLASPFLYFFREPVITFNSNLIISLIMLGFSTYLLTYELSREIIASLISGMLVTISPVVLDKITHLQVLEIWGVPLALLFFLKFLKNYKSKDLAFTFICFTLQTYNSFLPGYFILFSFLILSTSVYFNQSLVWRKLFTKKNVLVIIFTFIVLLPLVIPYYQVSKKYQFKRDIRDAIHLGLQFEDLLVGNQYTRLEPVLSKLTPQQDPTPKKEVKVGFIGGTLILLIIFMIFYYSVKRKRIDRYILSFFSIGILGLVLSFGPVLHLFRETIHHPIPIILPYTVFYYLVPGFNGMRNAARWEVLFVLMMSICVGLFLAKITNTFQSQKKTFIYLLLVFSIFLEFIHPDRFIDIPQKKDFPKVYSFLQTVPNNSVIIHFPIYPWYFPYSGEELRREYFSSINFRPMVNGSSGFSPAGWLTLASDLLYNFPSQKSINQLKSIGVDYIIVHTDEYDRLAQITDKELAKRIPNINKKLKQNSNLILVKNIDKDTVVYTVK